jgi:Mg2+-importing ATPase
VRLLSVTGLECNESVLTGEAHRRPSASEGTVLAELDSCALMGTVVTAGSGTGVVVATGRRAEFGRIAVGLGHRQPETEFQVGLRRFSGLLLTIALVLTGFILVTNLVLARPLLESILFSLAIAVGITPQLLPAVVSTSLATGSRRLARRKVLVKRPRLTPVRAGQEMRRTAPGGTSGPTAARTGEAGSASEAMS